MTDVNERLGQVIDHFIEDAARVHDFVKGDKTIIVYGEDGPYPSAAMMAATLQQKFDELFSNFSTKLKIVTTKPLLITNGRIQLPSRPLGDLVHNEARVFLDLTEADLSPTGELLGDRAYNIEEHVNVMVDDTVAIFRNADQSIDGHYAVVSYLAI